MNQRRTWQRAPSGLQGSVLSFEADAPTGIEYEVIACFIGDHFLENILDGRSRSVQCGLKLEAGIPDPHHVIEWALGYLGSCIYAMANGTTLHNDDRVVSVLSRNRC